MNCSSKINMLYYCVLCGLFFVYVVLLYTKRQLKYHVLEPVVCCMDTCDS